MKSINAFFYQILLFFIIMILLFISCAIPSEGGGGKSRKKDSSGDTEAPVAGELSFTDIQTTSIAINWTPANDNTTPHELLQYKLVKSNNLLNIDTLQEADNTDESDNVMDWTANTLLKTVDNLTANTSYYFAVIVKDQSNNKTLYTPKWEKTLDPSMPGISLWSAVNFNNTYYFKEDANIRLYGAGTVEYSLDGGSAWNVYSNQIVITEEGEYNFYARRKIDNNNWSDNLIRNLVVDKTAPIINLSVNGNEIPANAQSTVVTITENFIVNNVSTGYTWTTSSGFPSSPYLSDFKSGDTISKNGGNGDYYLHIQVTDIAGNQTRFSSNKFVLDNNSSVINFETNGNRTVSQNHSTIVTVTDNNTFETGFPKYQWTSSGTFPSGGTWNEFVSGAEISLGGVTGNYYLHVWVKDLAGNETKASSNYFVFDNTPPSEVTNFKVIGGRNMITLRWTRPGDSDFKNVEITYTPGGSTPIEVAKSSKNQNINGVFYTGELIVDNLTYGQTYTFTIKTVDTLGNKSSGITDSAFPVWTIPFGTSGYDRGNAIASDSNGNIYVTGYTSASLDGNSFAGYTDIFLIKYNSNGIRQWTKEFGTSNWDIATGIAIDQSDNIYITGNTGGSLDGVTTGRRMDFFIAKFDSSGNRIWLKQCGTVEEDEAYGIAVDGSNNIYVTGFTSGDLDGNTLKRLHDIFITKYNSNGARSWTKQFGTQNDDEGLAICVDNSGYIYVTGTAEGDLNGITLSDNKGFITKYDNSGTRQWLTMIDTHAFGHGITVDNSGNIYIAGVGGGIKIAKFNSTGSNLWVKEIDTQGTDRANCITVDGSGNIYFSGITYRNTNDGNFDVIIGSYSSNGDQLWIDEIGAVKSNFSTISEGFGITLSGSNYLYITGFTEGEFDGNIYLGDFDGFILKYDLNGNKQ